MDPTRLAVFKEVLAEIIINKGFIPDQESFDLFQKIVPWPATEVCLVNTRGELLLQRRHFKEWPGEWGKIDDWYIPGGYMKTEGSIEDWCRKHLAKDGVIAEFEYQGEVAGVIKWAPGEHPIGFPLSVNCVCRLDGPISFRTGTEQNFQFVDKVVPTAVPNHTKLQEMFFWWRNHNLHLFKRD
ncbi:MAG: hypothetical protein Q7K26_06780 [bacterium]|nr:hypothetical protein [bacterium]